MQTPFQGFADASHAVLDFLRKSLPFQVWMVTRTDGQEWVVLHADNDGIGVKTGDTLPYGDSFCSHVVSGAVPNMVADCHQVDCLEATMKRLHREIGAYISFPLQREDGSLFGTLCALDSHPTQADFLEFHHLLELLSRQLATILHFDLAREAAWRRAAQAEAEAMTDALTGLTNRRGWDWMCAREEQRCRDYGGPLCVLGIDLDGLKTVNDLQGHEAGDALIISAGRVLKATLRQDDTIARVGGDEFLVLLPGLDQAQARILIPRLHEQLALQGVKASIGLAQRKPYRGLEDAIKRADAAMYEEKRQRKTIGS